MKLPNRALAVIPDAKITHYLLDPEHEDGGPKAKFFIDHGFTLAEWPALAAFLLRHAEAHEVTRTVLTPFGLKYIIDGTMEMPSGQIYLIRVVWIIKTEEDFPRLVSAYPIEE